MKSKFKVKCCSGCGAKNVADHNKKIINKGVYNHPYDGPTGRHRLRNE